VSSSLRKLSSFSDFLVSSLPVLICPDDTTVIQDTSEIIDYLEAKHSDPPVYHDRSKFPLKSWANFMIEAFVDEFFIIYAMYYRW
jgi:glutathione S-transferase